MDLGDLKAKFEAFGWVTLVCEDGNDMEMLLNSIKLRKQQPEKENRYDFNAHGNG